jgi:hypothetical protein
MPGISASRLICSKKARRLEAATSLRNRHNTMCRTGPFELFMVSLHSRAMP